MLDKNGRDFVVDLPEFRRPAQAAPLVRRGPLEFLEEDFSATLQPGDMSGSLPVYQALIEVLYDVQCVSVPTPCSAHSQRPISGSYPTSGLIWSCLIRVSFGWGVD
jgi:hypothetical protein